MVTSPAIHFVKRLLGVEVKSQPPLNPLKELEKKKRK